MAKEISNTILMSELIDNIKEVGCYSSREEARSALDAVLKTIDGLVKQDKVVKIQNFGSFHRKYIKAMKRRAPNNKIVDAPAYSNIAFKPSQKLRITYKD